MGTKTACNSGEPGPHRADHAVIGHPFARNGGLITAVMGKAECSCNPGIPTYETNEQRPCPELVRPQTRHLLDRAVRDRIEFFLPALQQLRLSVG